MAKKSAARRQKRGSAWYWKQTDSWYVTSPGSKKRQPLLDGDGQRIRGEHNKQAAKLAVARLRLQRGAKGPDEPADSTTSSSS